jgi:hypothetical protein
VREVREKYDTHWGKYDSSMCAFVYENVILNGFGDDFLSNEWDGGWAELVGKRIIEGDSAGFVYLTTFASVSEAESAFAELGQSDYYRDEEES